MGTMLQEIDQKAQDYANARDVLVGIKMALEEEVGAIKRKYMPKIRKIVETAKERNAALSAAIAASPELFQKPRTVILHGIRLGIVKSRGELAWDDEAQVIKRIRAQLPKDQAELLIRVKESVAKGAVYDLTAADLKRLGIKIEGDGDIVTIKDAAGDLDKWLDAMLVEEPEEVEG